MGDGDGITVTAESLTVHASEKVSIAEYENATVSVTLDASIEGIDVSDGVPRELHERIHGYQHALQQRVEDAADARRARAAGDEEDEEAGG